MKEERRTSKKRDEVEESRRTKETEKGTRKEKSIRLTRERSDFPTEMVAALLFAAALASALASASASVEADREKEIFAIRINSTKAIPGISYGPTDDERYIELSANPLVFFRFFVHDVPFCSQNEPSPNISVSLVVTYEDVLNPAEEFGFNFRFRKAPKSPLPNSSSWWRTASSVAQEGHFSGFDLSIASQFITVFDFRSRTLFFKDPSNASIHEHIAARPAREGISYTGHLVRLRTSSESGFCHGFYKILKIPEGLKTAKEILANVPKTTASEPRSESPVKRPYSRPKKVEPFEHYGRYYIPFILGLILYGFMAILTCHYVKKTRRSHVASELKALSTKDGIIDSGEGFN